MSDYSIRDAHHERFRDASAGVTVGPNGPSDAVSRRVIGAEPARKKPFNRIGRQDHCMLASLASVRVKGDLPERCLC
jgi:hypothetical protein